MGTSLQGDQVQVHNLSGLPSLLVHEALANLWSESVISPPSHPIAWSAFLDWPIQFSKTSLSTALCAEHFSLQEIEEWPFIAILNSRLFPLSSFSWYQPSSFPLHTEGN